MTHLSDEFLLAYLDGQLEKEQADELSQLAGTNAEVSRRLMGLKRTQNQIVETFGLFAREEIFVPRAALQFDGSEGRQTPPGMNGAQTGTREAKKKGASTAKQIIFVAAVFAGGLLGGYGATVMTGHRVPLPQKNVDRAPGAIISSGWASDITRFHSYFPRETLTPYPDAIANPDLIRFQLAKITAKALVPPDFSHQGFTLYRGQTFNYRQDRMMQLTYSSKTEPPLTLYVLPALEHGDGGVTVQSLGSNKAASWVADRVRFLLTGEKNEEDLKVLAALAQSQMPRKP